MILTGVFLSLTISCKMVGLFAFLTVGTAVLIDMWTLLDIRRGHSIVSPPRPCVRTDTDELDYSNTSRSTLLLERSA